MNFLFLEPFFGGSHKDFAEGLIDHSRHNIDLVTLPARFWKWRMRGAALYFLKKITSLEKYNGLIVTDLMSLSDLKALSKNPFPPALVYFHENQFSYPLAPGEQVDYQFGFTDITTALAADRILFNSHTHYDAFFSKLPGFIKMMPDFLPGWVTEEIKGKSSVIYPGCQFPAAGKEKSSPAKRSSPPIIIWNHRWEFDKNPEDFFGALDCMLQKGVDFRLVLLGENFQKKPAEFLSARERYGDRIIQYGYVDSKQDYLQWLKKGSIVVSTARQENFGISIIEAIRYGCIPVLPNRLSYPEIIPGKFHSDILYNTQEELVDRLSAILQNHHRFQKTGEELSMLMGNFAWEKIIVKYDEVLDKLSQSKIKT